ncbi:MAG: hypothetical protein QM802_21835 [Agriterribacter sp.]
MRYGRNILILSLAIGLFLFFYIRSVQSERKDGITNFIREPRTGDIYKIRYDDVSGNRTVRYFKLAEKTETLVSFFPGKLSGWNVSDVFLDEYDRDRRKNFTFKDLQLIKEGKFSNDDMKNATLVEIERKAGSVPENSL